MKKESLVVILVFSFLIGGVTILSLLTPVQAFSESENRFLAKKPVFSKETLLSGEYTKEYETFLTDQFPMRNSFVGLKTKVELAIGKQEINGVYFGKDGYLIETHSINEIKEEQLKKNEERLINFLNNLKKNKEIEHVNVMLVPTANQILKEKLPLFASGYNQNQMIDDFVRRLVEEDLEQCFVDVRESLLQHQEEEIFYRTDHHWTSLGAFYAYQKWAEQIKVQPYLIEDYTIKEVANDFYGTIYSKVNVKRKPDTITIYEPKEKMEYQINYNMGEKQTTSLYDWDKLKERDKYAIYLGGNHAVVQIDTSNLNGKRLLIIKDSFAHAFAPFVINHYEQTQMIDLRYFNMPVSEFMDKNKFTDVLVLYNIPNFANDNHMSNLH